VLFAELPTLLHKKVWGNLFRGLGLAAALVSLVMFRMGAWIAADALGNHSEPTVTALPT
jgi:hypothetical protein